MQLIQQGKKKLVTEGKIVTALWYPGRGVRVCENHPHRPFMAWLITVAD